MALKKPQITGKANIRPPSNSGSFDEHPIFDFQYLGNYREIPRDEKKHFIDKLVVLSRLTWKEIHHSNRHQHGFERINLNQIRVQLVGLTEDVNQVDVFRYHEMKPMIGIRSGEVFKVMYLDYNFTAYRHD